MGFGDYVRALPLNGESEFMNACTQGGQTKFPYGGQYQPGTCVDFTWVDAGKGLAVTSMDRPCHGTIPPFDAVYDLSGSAVEWQNICRREGCVQMGSPTKSCADTDSWGTTFMRAVFPSTGFRCCADPVPVP